MSSLPHPLVSVILPVFNAQRYIRSAVYSVLQQTLADFELIVIDDGSTDQSRSILQDLAGRDRRIQLISRPNKGLVATLNEGIAAARGNFIARMDADDLCMPTRFARQVGYLNAHPECVLLGCDVLYIDEEGDPIGRMPDIAFGHEKITQDLLHRGWPIVHPSIMMRAEAVRTLGGYGADLVPNEDHDLFLRLGEIGQLENLPEVLLHYRKHATSISASQAEKVQAKTRQIIVEACARRGIPVPDEIANPKPKAPVTVDDLHRTWAWSALKHGYLKTARKYAFSTLRRHPLDSESWRLMLCAWRGW
jgi:glycosyltransferase involved in cell wall biosynthesis